jgi:hypothetical protein
MRRKVAKLQKCIDAKMHSNKAPKLQSFFSFPLSLCHFVTLSFYFSITLLLCVFVIFLSNCSHYSVSGSLPGYIKTAAVPLFQNDTVEPNVVEDVTDEVINAIISNGSMKIVNESQADAVVMGRIVEVINEADTYSKSEQAKQFKIHIYADVQFFDRKKNRPLWEEKRLEGWARYDASNPSARQDAIKEALKMLASLIVDKTVAGW